MKAVAGERGVGRVGSLLLCVEWQDVCASERAENNWMWVAVVESWNRGLESESSAAGVVVGCVANEVASAFLVE